MPAAMTFRARALQLGERIDIKGLERADGLSKTPLAFQTSSGGTVVLFRTGAAVFINMTPVEEDDVIRGLGSRITGHLAEREVEDAEIAIGADEDGVNPAGVIQLKAADPDRLLLIAEALAGSVSLAWDEDRVAGGFEHVAEIAEGLKGGRLKGSGRSEILSQIGETLSIQQRLAGRVDLDDKPDVLWDNPALERLWAKLVDEYDLKSRGVAISQKLSVIRDSAETLGDLLSTRTSHRLEWYIIALIALEIALQLYDRFAK